MALFFLFVFCFDILCLEYFFEGSVKGGFFAFELSYMPEGGTLSFFVSHFTFSWSSWLYGRPGASSGPSMCYINDVIRFSYSRQVSGFI